VQEVMVKKFMMLEPKTWTWHRGAWNDAVSALLQYFCAPQGTLLVEVEEKLFADRVRRPFVLISHFTVDTHPGFPENYSLVHFLASRAWQENRQGCLGCYCLSAYAAEYWRKCEPWLALETVYLPVSFDYPQFSYDLYSARKTVVQLGHWLRIADSLRDLRTTFEKVFLPGDATVVGHFSGGVTVDFLPPLVFDELMTRCVVFMHLYEASANNGVVDCIARGTPLLVNKVGGVVEYLGENYPLYFEDLEDAANKLADPELIRAAHAWLISPAVREKVALETFVRRIGASALYAGLPERDAGSDTEQTPE
jgi:hypothetical protein